MWEMIPFQALSGGCLPGPRFQWPFVPLSIFLRNWASERLTSFLMNFSCSLWDLLWSGQGGADGKEARSQFSRSNVSTKEVEAL